MNYSLFKLRFETAVHFGLSDSALSLYTSGDHFYADTLFSALCHAAHTLYGAQGVESLCEQVRAGALFLSDSMPWAEDMFYLPKPVLPSTPNAVSTSHMRKAMKALHWISVEAMPSFLHAMETGVSFDAASHTRSFSLCEEITKVGFPGSPNGSPYQLGVTYFYPHTGLYFIAGYQEENQEAQLRTLLDCLGWSGMGGKTSAGYGKFSVIDQIYLNEPFDAQTEWLWQGLSRQDATSYLLLTSSLPTEKELDEVLPCTSYQLIRRGGYVYPDGYRSEVQKKDTQYYFAAGAVTQRRYLGALYPVGHTGEHPIYRYSKPLFLGVS